MKITPETTIKEIEDEMKRRGIFALKISQDERGAAVPWWTAEITGKERLRDSGSANTGLADALDAAFADLVPTKLRDLL